MVEVKIFTDVIDALEKVGKGVVAVNDLPRKTRQSYADTVSEAFAIMDSALGLIYTRLGDLCLIENQDDFLKELARLDNVSEWTQIEKDMRLCRNLRAVHREMESFVPSKMGQLAVADWDNLQRRISQIIHREGELADFICRALSKLAQGAGPARDSARGYENIRRTVLKTKNAVKTERQRLIGSELEFLDSLKLRKIKTG